MPSSSLAWILPAVLCLAAACSDVGPRHDRGGGGTSGGNVGNGGASIGGAVGTGGATAAGGAGGTVATGGTTAGGTTGTGGGPTGPFSVEGPLTWKYGRTAAYSIIHDDTCVVETHFTAAAPALTERGLVAGFGVVGQACDEGNRYAELNGLVANGHEIINHSWSHPVLSVSGDLATEVDHTKSTVDANVTGQSVSFFIFPQDSANDQLRDYLRQHAHLGARNGSEVGDRGLNDANFPDPMKVKFDVFGPGFSIYVSELYDFPPGPCPNDDPGKSVESYSFECQMYVLNHYVDDAMALGGWGVREFHGVADDSWQPVPTMTYTQHLDYVKSKVDSGELWMQTPTKVLKYRFARQHCGAASVAGNMLSFASASSADCVKYATELSVAVTLNEGTTLQATQGGQSLTVELVEGQRYMLQIDPTKGPVTLGAT